jgi:predicted DNA-binding protein
MRGKLPDRKSLKAPKKVAVRASISFPPELYETLEDLAKRKKVSLAWVVREASEKYIKSEVEQSRESGRR